ncbi:hypothetical protein AMTR_s00049p00212540 [Amborella trichopoda]|uniref:Uncharacterized protein n=1 Tax=Amborella trichopoda TaxID=13333 RepID=W1PZJ5_AMBTC|nr:hypothetical protein AMTR_s00049p00212540 [Amborella trichopoda]
MRIDNFLEVRALSYGSVGILSLGKGGGEVGGGGGDIHQGLLRGVEAGGGEEWQSTSASLSKTPLTPTSASRSIPLYLPSYPTLVAPPSIYSTAQVKL